MRCCSNCNIEIFFKTVCPEMGSDWFSMYLSWENKLKTSFQEALAACYWTFEGLYRGGAVLPWEGSGDL